MVFIIRKTSQNSTGILLRKKEKQTLSSLAECLILNIYHLIFSILLMFYVSYHYKQIINPFSERNIFLWYFLEHLELNQAEDCQLFKEIK